MEGIELSNVKTFWLEGGGAVVEVKLKDVFEKGWTVVESVESEPRANKYCQ
jgi:hypothetical protein